MFRILREKTPLYRKCPNMNGMARLRVSRDAKESIWSSLRGRNLMISSRISRGNSGESLDGAIMVDVVSGQGQGDRLWDDGT